MPEVTGYTTDKVDALIANSVVGANIDPGTGVLTLALRDGTTVNVGSVLTAVPAATTTVSGKVELATDVETQAGTDTTRAVTPFGLAAVIATTAAKGIVELATNAETLTGTDAVRAVTPAGLASIPGVKILADPGEAATVAAYPIGVSLIKVTGSAWSLNSGAGAIFTFNEDNGSLQQHFMANFGGSQAARQWYRTWHATNGGGGWTAWRELPLMPTASANGDFAQFISGGWTNRTPAQVASTLSGAGTAFMWWYNGASYSNISGATIYVGPNDPGGVAAGSLWIDTTGS